MQFNAAEPPADVTNTVADIICSYGRPSESHVRLNHLTNTSGKPAQGISDLVEILTSTNSVAFLGTRPGTPRSPNARWGGIIRRRVPPTRIPCTPSSIPNNKLPPP